MIYLDTSAAVPLFVSEPASGQVEAWFAACDEPLVSSDWMVSEFGSALAIKTRTGALSARDANAVWRSFEDFCHSGLRLAAVSRRAFAQAAALARHPAHGLRAGDALHLAVAREIGARSMATLDDLMATNAKRLMIKVVGFS